MVIVFLEKTFARVKDMNMVDSTRCTCRCYEAGMVAGKQQEGRRDKGSLSNFGDWLSLALAGPMTANPMRGSNPLNPLVWGGSSTAYGSSLNNSLLVSGLSGNTQSNSLMLSGLLRYAALNRYSRKGLNQG